jgi:DNA-binding NarL/FixJ family response regulator
MISTPKYEPVRIGLATDVPMRIAGFISIFNDPAEPGHPQLLPVVGSLDELLASQALDYLIVDMECSSIGQTSLAAICRLRPDVRLIVIAAEGNDDLAVEAILVGARGYLTWSDGPADIRIAVDVINRGFIWAANSQQSKVVDRLLKEPRSSIVDADSYLTDREQQVLGLILDAQSNREIARQLCIEERTVRSHLGRLMRKTGVKNRVQLSMHALNHRELLDKCAVRIRQHDPKSQAAHWAN